VRLRSSALLIRLSMSPYHCNHDHHPPFVRRLGSITIPLFLSFFSCHLFRLSLGVFSLSPFLLRRLPYSLPCITTTVLPPVIPVRTFLSSSSLYNTRYTLLYCYHPSVVLPYHYPLFSYHTSYSRPALSV
jgi:hypothetical protein